MRERGRGRGRGNERRDNVPSTKAECLEIGEHGTPLNQSTVRDGPPVQPIRASRGPQTPLAPPFPLSHGEAFQPGPAQPTRARRASFGGGVWRSALEGSLRSDRAGPVETVSEDQRRALEELYQRLEARATSILWSNQDALEVTLAQLGGAPSTFFEWFAAHP